MVRVFRHYVHAWQIGLAACDAIILLAAYFTGVFARFADLNRLGFELRLHANDAAIFVAVLLAAMYAFGVYHSKAIADNKVMLVRLSVSFLVGFVAVATIEYSFPTVNFWRSALAIAMAVGYIGIIAVRLLCLPVLKQPAFRRRVIVLGAGERAARIEALERAQPSRDFECVGFLAFGENRPAVPADRVFRGPDGLADLTKTHQADEIVVALQDRRNELPVDVLLGLKMGGVTVLDFASFWERHAGRIDLDNVYPSWLIFSEGFDDGPWRRLLKRAFDLAFSLAFALFLLPMCVMAAIAVKLDSRGPVLYRQERVGRHGHVFGLLKFRSMRQDAEKLSGPTWAAERDPRITRIGRFLRMTRIDELPQLFNVLRGDMSFIGPRPERPFFVDQLAQVIPYYRERHRVKPGISGWAQINYPYGASVEDAKQKLEFDLYYAKNFTLGLDVMILLQTTRVVLWPEAVR